jgi:aconitate hydratase
MPEPGDIEYSQVLELTLNDVQPSVAGPKRPQDRLLLPEVKSKFRELFHKPLAESGYNKPTEELSKRFAIHAAAPTSTVTGGGAQASETVPQRAPHQVHPNESAKNTSGQTELEMMNNRPTPDRVEKAQDGPIAKEVHDVGHGDVLIAAITSCTNTSNPSVMLAAGCLRRKPSNEGLKYAQQ